RTDLQLLGGVLPLNGREACQRALRPDTMDAEESPMIKLTDEQVAAVAQAGQAPLSLVDPRTNVAYVLVRKDIYDDLRAELDEGPEMRQVAVLVEQAMREDDANDPLCP